MLRLRHDTPAEWLDCVNANLGAFLQDHASNERKVATSALTLATHYPFRDELVGAMIELAREELEHFHQVWELLRGMGMSLALDAPDPYMKPIMKLARRRDHEHYLMDRLLLFGMVEARGCERFRMLSEGLKDPQLREFYAELTRCEARHHGLFVRLAKTYFDPADVVSRLDELLDAEAEVSRGLAVRPALH